MRQPIRRRWRPRRRRSRRATQPRQAPNRVPSPRPRRLPRQSPPPSPCRPMQRAGMPKHGSPHSVPWPSNATPRPESKATMRHPAAWRSMRPASCTACSRRRATALPTPCAGSWPTSRRGGSDWPHGRATRSSPVQGCRTRLAR
ncbi:MAG: hypothetical protein DWI03_07935 [Planctomycetota bacterium]|nr:MAG: hypothetical protein DWI03_07935 [Planctomycetota bacterium]